MSELALLLTGAAIALVSSIVTAIATHLLSLRADRIKRERDKSVEDRKDIVKGARDMAVQAKLRTDEGVYYFGIEPSSLPINPENFSELMTELAKRGEGELASELLRTWMNACDRLEELVKLEVAEEPDNRKEGQDEPAE